MTMGIHHVDTINCIFGPIKTVFSYFNKHYISAEVEDVNMVIFQFESGILCKKYLHKPVVQTCRFGVAFHQRILFKR
jgi:predicted dehydrogenase